MEILTWQDEYNSGIPLIDAQHKNLFEMLGSFVQRHDEKTNGSVIVPFLEILLVYFRDHYDLEEEMMDENNYPLKGYHKMLHTGNYSNIKRLLLLMKRGRIASPYNEVTNLAGTLQRHLIRDDQIFFHHCEYKGTPISDDIIGNPCEMFTLDNKFIGRGEIMSIGFDEVVIDGKTKGISISPDEVVKVAVIMQNSRCYYFVAEFHRRTGPVLRFFHSTLIKTVNEREFYRIPVTINAHLQIDSKMRINIVILDISAGGILIEADCNLVLGGKVIVDFAFEDSSFVEVCKVMRKYKKDMVMYHYGLKFVNSSRASDSGLVSLLTRLQIKRSRSMD